MTIETKTTIQLSDIGAVEFECKKCHSINSWPLSIAKNPPTKCHCSEEQWMPYGGEMYAALTNLLELMRRYSKADQEPFAMCFSLKPSVLDRASDGKD